MNINEKIFCLGFPKTGTSSIEQGLEILNYKVCKGYWGNTHSFYLFALLVNKDYNEILRMTKYWDAFADAPWGGSNLYIKLLEIYPNAKYILTVREPESWYKSFEKLITMFDLNPDTALTSYHANGMWGSAYYFETIFNIKTLAGNKQKIIDTYIKHNNDIKAYFNNNQKELLILDLSKVNGWDAICPFLNCTIPNTAFPHLNKSEYNPYLRNTPKNEANDIKINESTSIKHHFKKIIPHTLRKKIRAFINA